MKAVQVVIEEQLLDQADRQARRAKLDRSELFRRALREYLSRQLAREMEERDRRGYVRQPVRAGEFDVWGTETAWPEG